MLGWFKRFIRDNDDDGFDAARVNAATECLNRGGTIQGTMYSDGTIEVKEDTMKMREIVAHKIWEIREDLDIGGSQEHDWWLASEFLQEMKDKSRWDDDTIYSWFIQLDENLVQRQTEETWD